jgi:hypothetical protein
MLVTIVLMVVAQASLDKDMGQRQGRRNEGNGGETKTTAVERWQRRRNEGNRGGTKATAVEQRQRRRNEGSGGGTKAAAA